MHRVQDQFRPQPNAKLVLHAVLPQNHFRFNEIVSLQLYYMSVHWLTVKRIYFFTRPHYLYIITQCTSYNIHVSRGGEAIKC